MTRRQARTLFEASARPLLTPAEQARIKASMDSHYRRIVVALVGLAVAFIVIGLWLRFSTD